MKYMDDVGSCFVVVGFILVKCIGFMDGEIVANFQTLLDHYSMWFFFSFSKPLTIRVQKKKILQLLWLKIQFKVNE